MSTSVLRYFVDTNLFFQCRPLDQLDWSPWHGFDEVHLIVSRPVLREVDHRKNRGNDRVGRRARATSAMFRKIRSTGKKLVHAAHPKVVLSIELHHNYSDRLADRLDYAERDDQLVGIIYDFAEHNQTSNVRLLTHDTTPLLVAQGLNLTADLIPDDWLLPPENTKAEKKLQFLEKEIARLKKTEPSFSIRFLDHADEDTDRYQASHTWFDPLTDKEIDELMKRLKESFPLETDFGSTEPAERAAPATIANIILGAKQTFVPASDEMIVKYRDRSYPQWLASCEEILRGHHRFLQRKSPALEFSFLVTNRGTRPARDALITITAKGDFQIKPPPAEDGDEGHEIEDNESSNRRSETLPEPPVAPHGYWQNTSGIDEVARSLSAFSDLRHNLSDIDRYRSVSTLMPDAFTRDANAFYYKPHRPSTPIDTFSLECAQWRHDDGEEDFVGEIHVRERNDYASGVLRCRIQASNLATSESKTIPVRIKVTHVSAFQSARQMIERLATKRSQTG